MVNMQSSIDEDYDNLIRMNNGSRKMSDDDEEEEDEYRNFDPSNQRRGVNSERPKVEQERRIRREIANCNERRRMQSINAGFQSLRSLLPRQDDEKISKASILQQTVELIRTLQTENQRLTAETVKFKLMLSQQLESSVQSPRPRIMAPPKKRRCFTTVDQEGQSKKSPEMTVESSDEGVGMMSDDAEIGTGSKSYNNNNNNNNNNNQNWELELIRQQLIQVRLAVDQERQLRLVYEEELRKRDIAPLMTTLPAVHVENALPSNVASNNFSVLNHPMDRLVTNNDVQLFESTVFCSNSSPKQSLQVIVEAIRHLEGEHFIEPVVRSPPMCS